MFARAPSQSRCSPRRRAVGDPLHGSPMASQSGETRAYTPMPGYSTLSNGVVLDLDNLHRHPRRPPRGDRDGRRGSQLLSVYLALAAHGATVPAGSCPSVGVGGHALSAAGWDSPAATSGSPPTTSPPFRSSRPTDRSANSRREERSGSPLGAARRRRRQLRHRHPVHVPAFHRLPASAAYFL